MNADRQTSLSFPARLRLLDAGIITGLCTTISCLRLSVENRMSITHSINNAWPSRSRRVKLQPIEMSPRLDRRDHLIPTVSNYWYRHGQIVRDGNMSDIGLRLREKYEVMNL